MKKATCIDVYDKDGNLTYIEAYDLEGEFIIQAEWDPHDAQTSENRVAFRKWFYTHLKRKGYENP